MLTFSARMPRAPESPDPELKSQHLSVGVLQQTHECLGSNSASWFLLCGRKKKSC